MQGTEQKGTYKFGGKTRMARTTWRLYASNGALYEPLSYENLIQSSWPGYGVFLRRSFKSIARLTTNVYTL